MSSIRARLLTRVALAATVAVTAAACGSTGRSLDSAPLLPTSQFPLATTTAPSGIRLAPHDYGLSPAQAEALRELAADWRANGEGLILVEAPVCACDEGAVTAYDAVDALMVFGVPRDSIRLIGYEAEPRAPIRVSFQRLAAQVNNCAQWGDLTKSGQNQARSNFGCAVNSNLAAMIESPADINRPRTMDPYDAGRRQVVIERYRAGEATGSVRDEAADGTISQAVN